MKVLILGASGYLGNVLFCRCKEIDKNISAYGTYLTKPADSMMYFDVLDRVKAREIIEFYAPHVIVWCLYNKQNEVEISNVGLRNVLSIIEPATKFIYISTTLSQTENQDEETLPQPKTKDMHLASYVNGKILGERLIKNHRNHVIIRPGQIWGFDAKGELDVRMRRIKRAIEKNGEMERLTNAFISIIHVNDLADCIVELCFNDFIGTLCVASHEPISYYEFYTFLAKLIGVPENKIVPKYDNNVVSTNFNTTKANSLLRTEIRSVSQFTL